MSTKLLELFGSLQSDEEKQDFLEAQFQVLTNLNKQVEQLKAEKKNLELQLKAATPNIIVENEDGSSDEEKICKEQLRIFKNLSQDRELTLEETRKVEIYSKILLQGKNNIPKPKSLVDKLNTEQLLQIVRDDTN